MYLLLKISNSYATKMLRLLNQLTVLVFKPDLDEPVVATGGGEESAVRTEGHVKYRGSGGTAPHTVPAPLLLLQGWQARWPHRILPYLKCHSTSSCKPK